MIGARRWQVVRHVHSKFYKTCLTWVPAAQLRLPSESAIQLSDSG